MMNKAHGFNLPLLDVLYTALWAVRGDLLHVKLDIYIM